MSEPKRYYDSHVAADQLGRQLLETGQKPSIDDLMLKYKITEPEARRLSANLHDRAAVLFLESVQPDIVNSGPKPIGAWDQGLSKFVLF